MIDSSDTSPEKRSFISCAGMVAPFGTKRDVFLCNYMWSQLALR